MWKTRGDVRNREVMFKRRDGTVFPALLSASSVFDEDGNVVAANTLIRDMSDLYHAQKEIEELRLKRLSVIGELTARIAHDLRNPLSVIKNSVEILRLSNEENIDDSTKSQWDRLERAIYRMTHQVDDVLDYIRAPPLKTDEYSLSVIIQDALERIQIPDTVSIHPPKNDALILCDAEKLEVVFVNLVMNAIQAFEGKSGDVTITIDDNYNEQSVLIQIIDNGSGIPNNLIEKIFDPLFTTRQIGTGLGLPSCKNIVERHNGTINVTSKFNAGTTFSIILPKNNKKLLKSELQKS
jgi:signal transduction histidine kinase